MNAGEDPVLRCPQGPGLLPGSGWAPEQGGAAPISHPEDPVHSLSGAGYGSYGYGGATSATVEAVSVCFSLSELGRKLKFSPMAWS